MLPQEKDLLNEVLIKLNELQTEIGVLKITQSDMLNKQDGYIKKQDEIISILENNDKIGQVGYIQKVDMIDTRLIKVESDVKMGVGKITFATATILAVGGLMIKLYTMFK